MRSRPRAPVSHATDRTHGEGQRDQREQGAGPVDGDHGDAGERDREAPDVEHPRAGVAETHGQRALARDTVSGDVAEVVHDEQRDGEEADRDRRQEIEGMETGRLHVRRAGRGHEAEEDEHEQLPEPGIAVRPRTAGVEPSGGDRQAADDEQLRADRDRERQARHRSDAERGERGPADRGGRGETRCHETDRPDARASSVPRTPSE